MPGPRVSGRPPIELRAGDARLTIDVERGGRLATWTVDGRELLVGPPNATDRSIRWGCFLMAPWAGRLVDGRFRAGDGRAIQLPRTHGRHAIHGLLWDRAWTVESAGRDQALLACALPPGLWPPGGVVRHEIRLRADRLDMAATVIASRTGRHDMPAAVGWHPWFRRDGDVSLQVGADAVLATRRLIPTGELLPVAGKTDLRRGPELGHRRLDHAYVDAASPAVLMRRDVELTIAFEPTPATVVVHTPPISLCVEPQTAWPNAPALPTEARDRAGLRWLQPGQALKARMSISVRPR